MRNDTGDAPAEPGLLTSTTVLLPGTRLTYHFEQDERRELVENALYQNGHVVVIRTETGEFDGELEEPAVGTLAEIVDAARPAPGRLIAVLGGVQRVRVENVSGSGAERSAEWSEWTEAGGGGRPSEVRAGDVLGLLDRLRERGVEMAGAVNRQLRDAPPSKVADVAASVAFEDVDIHQRLLEETDVLTRLERVESQLDTLLRSLED